MKYCCVFFTLEWTFYINIWSGSQPRLSFALRGPEHINQTLAFSFFFLECFSFHFSRGPWQRARGRLQSAARLKAASWPSSAVCSNSRRVYSLAVRKTFKWGSGNCSPSFYFGQIARAAPSLSRRRLLNSNNNNNQKILASRVQLAIAVFSG